MGGGNCSGAQIENLGTGVSRVLGVYNPGVPIPTPASLEGRKSMKTSCGACRREEVNF